MRTLGDNRVIANLQTPHFRTTFQVFAALFKPPSNVNLQGKIEPTQRVPLGKREREEGAVDGAVAEKSGEGDGGGAGKEPHSMPGILPRSEGTSKPSAGTKMTADTQQGTPLNGSNPESRFEEHRNGNLLTNGIHEYVNGISANGLTADSADVEPKASGAFEKLMGQLPPEIEHITFGYVSLHTLISRLVQETFLGLTETINEMSDIPVPPFGQQAPLNNLNQLVNGAGDSSGGNVQKKLRWLKFTSDRRAQFIKILVLLRWARQAEAVSRVIDLNVWTNTRLQEYKDCISWMGELKRILVQLREPNPDIKTALEVLSLGKASWLPDLGYLPPERLSARELLSTLRKINTLLSIRLDLHERIPPAFRDFSIGSGRATFRVPEEFEVDLSIAEEDPSLQLYFIDFRFIFCPTPPELPAGRLRDEIEGRANDVLKREGLEGLFEFLHNLTLTHKLSVLRNQAHEMARGYWSEQLRMEAVHRSLVVQYWSNRPGGKNWIEIGLKRGEKVKSAYALNNQRISCIGLRWFRGGKEVPNVQIVMKLGDLSLTNIVKQVIALHTSYTFEQMAANLRGSLLYSEGSLRLKSYSSGSEPMDASLLVQLTTSKAIKVIQEPVSGRFSIMPASQLNSRAEYELNRVASPAIEGTSQLTHLRSLASQEEADMGTRKMGWESIRALNPNQETTQRLFGKGIQHKKFFKRSTWNPSWILAFTTSLEGDYWWIVEFRDKKTTTDTTIPNPTAGATLQSAYEVLIPGTDSRVTDPSYETLADIESTAASMICQFVDTRALLVAEYPHKVQRARRKATRTQPGSLLIRIPSKVAPSDVRSGIDFGLPWLEEAVRLDFCGLDSSKRFARHVARVQMQHTFPNLQSLLARIPSLTLEPANQESPQTLRFHFLTQIGETVISSLQSRLKAVNLLLDFAATLSSHNLPCNAASLTRLIFQYTSSAPPLKATLHFPSDAPKHITLFQPNPHLRIVDFLTAQLRARSLSPLIGILRMTLPLLRTFSLIEAGQDGAGVNVLTRSDQWYQVRYSEPVSKGGFDVRLGIRRDDAMWFVPESSVKRPESVDEAFEKDLKGVMRGKGDGWWGVNGGMIAHIGGVENLVVKLDQVFRMNKHAPGGPNAKKRKAEEEVVEIPD